MRYAEFRDQLEGALRDEGLFFAGVDRRVETIDLESTVRHWKVHVHRTAPATAEPFHLFAAIEFDWSPVDAARAYTCEEDLLTEPVGRRRRLPRRQTFKTAFNDWTESICALATWIRYSPPPPGAKPAEPWFDDGGPETTH